VAINADEESKSEPPDLIAALAPFVDGSESGESSLELLSGPLVDMMTQESESDRGPGQPESDRVTNDELQAVGSLTGDPACGKQFVDMHDMHDQLVSIPG